MACPAAAMRFSRCAAQRVCFSVSSVFSRRMRTCSSSASSTPAAAVPAAAAAAGGSNSSKPLLLLGIESSCDDTGAAVLTSDGKVLGEALATQAELHAPWGGVVPSIAQAAHREAIDRVVEAALSQAGISAAQLDAVAVTVGPGLSLCLDVGVRKARDVSRQHSLPLVPIHHMEVGPSHNIPATCGAFLSVCDNVAFCCVCVCHVISENRGQGNLGLAAGSGSLRGMQLPHRSSFNPVMNPPPAAHHCANCLSWNPTCFSTPHRHTPWWQGWQLAGLSSCPSPSCACWCLAATTCWCWSKGWGTTCSWEQPWTTHSVRNLGPTAAAAAAAGPVSRETLGASIPQWHF